jgi:AP-2 complex subunit alpha
LPTPGRLNPVTIRDFIEKLKSDTLSLMSSIVSSLGAVFQKGSIRGLRNFITEILDCQSKEEERNRVRKELSNILKNFKAESLTGYNRKKYIAKLLYIHLLGYSYDFGFPQMIELLTSPIFSEKQIGYITIGVYLNGNYDLVSLLIEHLRKEMKSVENEPAQCLALAAAANIGGTQVAETLAPTILSVLTAARSSEFVKKKAALALVRLYREVPSTFVYTEQVGSVLAQLLQDPNFGVQISGCNLVLVLLVRCQAELQNLFPIALQQLTRIFFEFSIAPEYQYGRNPVPWLVTRYLRILQYKTVWSQDDIAKVTRVIDVCLQKTELTLSVKEINANLMLLFEAVNLIVTTQLTPQFLSRSATILGGFLSAQQSNVRYMSLETLTRLVSAAPDVIPSLDKHRQTLFQALRDPDNSIRRRALSLLYVLCTPESAEEIVAELLNYLKFADITMREPLCLKIAVLAESFMTDLAWYVDTILTLITLAGDECHDGVWHRVVQVISMNPQYQRYATLTSFNSMTSPTAHDRLVKLAAQLCGEYAHLIPNPPDEVAGELTKKYPSATSGTQAMIISALAKMGARCPPIREKVASFLGPLRASQQLEIQQRAIEYYTLLTANSNLLGIVFKPVPAFKPRESFLIKKVLETVELAPVAAEEEENEEDAGEVTGPVARPPGPAARAQAPAPASPPPTAVAAPAPAPPVDDLLGGALSGPPPPAPAGPAVPTPQATSLMDLYNEPQPPPEDLLTAFSGPGPAVLTNKEAIYKRFLTTDSAVAFEDQLVAVNLTFQTNGPNVVLTFIITNKSNQNLANVKLHVLPVPFLKASARPGPPTLGPQQTSTHQFAFTVVAPFSDPPQYSLSYNDVRETLKLPLFITKFMVPFSMNFQVFFERWAIFAVSNQVARASYPIQAPGDPTQQMALLMTNLLRVPVLPLEVPPGNVCGAGIVQCEQGPQGILARFFLDQQSPGTVQIEVRCTSPQIAGPIQQLLNLQFT